MARISDTFIYTTIIDVKRAESDYAARPLGLIRDYEPSLKEVLGHEGGYTNEAADPGGPTNWGITLQDARMYWRVNASATDVRLMPLSVAKDIYKSKYWARVRGDELPAGIDYCVFDEAVNSGLGRAIPALQKLLGVPADGRLGPVTMVAVLKRCSTAMGTRSLIQEYQDERLAFLKRLRIWPVYGKGWGKRVADVRIMALKLVDNPTMTVEPAPKVDRPVTPPVTNTAPKPAPAPPMSNPAKPPMPAPAPKPTGLFAALGALLTAIFRKR